MNFGGRGGLRAEPRRPRFLICLIAGKGSFGAQAAAHTHFDRSDSFLRAPPAVATAARRRGGRGQKVRERARLPGGVARMNHSFRPTPRGNNFLVMMQRGAAAALLSLVAPRRSGAGALLSRAGQRGYLLPSAWHATPSTHAAAAGVLAPAGRRREQQVRTISLVL